MSDWGYVALAWGVTVVVLVTYALWIIARGRSLSRRVPPEDRRWM
jgi:heme exporter protein CcmD